MDHAHHSTTRMAVSATLHCLTGCAIGEVLGMILGMLFGFTAAATVALAVGLAFVFGFGLSALPLLRAGFSFFPALKVVAAADTLSILTMEIVDNLVMVAIPGAMDSGLTNPIFWLSLAFALTAAFFAALPVNIYLLKRQKGHALTMSALHSHHNHTEK